MLRLFLLFVALSPLFAAQKPPEVSFPAVTKVGNLKLDAGVYQVRLQGSILFFTNAAGKSVSTFVRLVKLEEKSSATAVMGGEKADGFYHVTWIILSGSDFRLEF